MPRTRLNVPDCMVDITRNAEAEVLAEIEAVAWLGRM